MKLRPFGRRFIMADSIFTKIINKEIESDIIFEDEVCLAIHDINPIAPIHALLIPKKPIPMLSRADDDDYAILGHLMLKADTVADKLGIKDDFRLVINNGGSAGQTIFHMHVHILGGRRFNWPPG